MSLTAPQDTLAYQANRPLRALTDLRGVESKHIAGRVKAFLAQDKTPTVSPEAEALWFYGMHHGLGQILARYDRYEPLPPPLLEFVIACHAELVPRAMRAFCYLLLICTRECRHLKTKDAFKNQTHLYGPAAVYLGHVPDSATQAMSVFCDQPPAGSFGPYVKLMCDAFYHGSWSSGYGGKKWGLVADCLRRFVFGDTSAEVMLDTVWTLAHNNGPIFNKGMLYGPYTPVLQRVLDVQRSGQIPEMILTDDPASAFVAEDLRRWMTRLDEALPGLVRPYVDWWQVELFGAQQAYPQDKEAQVAKFGPSPVAQKAEQIAKQHAALLAAKEAAEAEAYAKAWFEVMPGLQVQKVARAA